MSVTIRGSNGTSSAIQINGVDVLSFNETTGAPTFPTNAIAITQAAGTDTTAVATTAFVNAEITADRPWEATATNIKINGTQAVGSLSTVARADHVHPSDTSRAPLASPSLTGTPLSTTAAAGTNTTQIATTAFVNTEIANDTDYLADFRAYDTGRTYALNDPTFYNGVPYKSLQAGNANNTPSTSPTWWEVTGGGSGIGSVPGINFDNGQFDAKQITGWSKYNDGAVAVPSTGTGAAGSIGFAHDTTNPLVGTGMAKITKTAINEQGEGISYPFTVDLGARNTPLKITFQYLTEGTTYNDGDIGCYVYDVTNAALLYPSIVNIPASGSTPAKFESSLWLNANSGSYRLIFHIQTATTTGNAYTFKLDNIQIEPLVPSLGAVISEWRDYTPPSNITNLPGSWTVARQRRSGGNVELNLMYTTSGAATATISLPNTNIIPSGISSSFVTIFPVIALDSNGGRYNINYAFSASGGFYYGASPVSASVPFTWVSGDVIYFNFSVPISQWSANTNLVENFTEYASNTSDVDGDASVATSVPGASGSPLPNASFTTPRKRYVRFSRPIQSADILQVEILSQGLWIAVGGNAIAGVGWGFQSQNNVGYGLGYYGTDTTPTDAIIQFGRYSLPTGTTYGAAGATWATYSASFKWRVRKISNGNTAEVPSMTISPLSAVAASGASASFTIPFAVGERKLYIPSAYLKTAGTAGTLTVTTGVGGSTPLVIPLSASTDTMTSGDLLVGIYISPNGSVVAEKWIISGSNTNGSYEKDGDGMMQCWNTGSVTDWAIDAAYGTMFQGTRTFDFPAVFAINPTPTGAHAKYGTSASWANIAGNSSTTQFSIRAWDITSRPTGTAVVYGWQAIGRWKV